MLLFRKETILRSVTLSFNILAVCQVHGTTMRVVKQDKFGPAQELYISDGNPIPKPLGNQVLIDVFASALNRADLLMRAGKYPNQKKQITLGLEVAGVVSGVGEASNKFKIGDKVMALLPGGGYAENVVVDENHVMPIPQSLDFNQGTAIPEAWLTAYQLLHFIGKVQKGETVLIHGGGSGVGTAAVQLVKLAGAEPIVTAGSAKKIEFAKSLGATEGFNYKEGEFIDGLMKHTSGKGVNLILDCVGSSFWKQNIAALAMEGRWVLYGLMGGINVDGPLLAQILGKRASLTGTTLLARSSEYKAELVSEFTKNALPNFSATSNQTLKPIVDKVFDLTKVTDAHLYMESNQSNGKIILSVRDSPTLKTEF